MDDDDWDDELLSKIDDLESLHLRAAAERQVGQQQHHHQYPQSASTQQQQLPQQQQHAAETQWACKSCTLLNDATRSTCMVCGTPQGRTFNSTTQRNPASSSSSNAFHHVAASQAAARKTVQATLPFAPPPPPQPSLPPSSTRRTPTAHAQPVPAPPSSAFWQPQQQQQQSPQRQLQPQRHAQTPTTQSSASATPTTELWRHAYKPTTSSAYSPQRNAVRQTTITPSQSHPPQPPPKPHATGEDPQAKTRYVDVLDRTRFPAIDYEAAQQFVYPTNYAVRAYQLTIAEKALYHNTLVSLPTGLGKTLIASVVMYNFYRWFPHGKVVFMAPTKPLVAQQIQACHEIMGIPLSDTAELQGNVPPARRKTLWRDKRVFFCTPQSMQNDLANRICQAERFVCLVVDEAHRATGNYAYCCVIDAVEKLTPFFRVLALSATPGAKFEIIQDVISNLRITHIESRSADDVDVKQYTHARQEEVIKCTLSHDINDVKALFLLVFDRITTRLVAGNIIQHRDPEKLTRWYVLQMRERFRQSPQYQANRAAESDLALLVSLLHAKELLTVHGLSSFHECINDWIEERERGSRLTWSKKELLASQEFHNLVLKLDAVRLAPLPAGSSNTKASASHPKLLKLRQVLLEHFERHARGESSTRAIVFTQYRTSVTEIVGLLTPLAPLIHVQAFVGQGTSGKAKESKGQSQKQQQEIVRKFRDGAFNVLVATCIAEEGLDIGEVDLIVSFDALTSPVRMIQRMGRTGRKRVGRVIILVTEGDEEKKLARSVASAKTVSRAMTTYKSKFVYRKCPRMLPHGISPTLTQLEMTIPEFHASQIGGKAPLVRSKATTMSSAADAAAREQRRWQLSDSEHAVVTTRFAPLDFAVRPRQPIVPLTTRSQSLLRTVTVRLRNRNERIASDTFQIGHARQSTMLRQLVRRIHGMEATDDDEEEIVEVDRDNDKDDDDDGCHHESIRQSTTHDTQADSTQNHAAAAHDFSFSAATANDESIERSVHETSFGSSMHDTSHHFSPGWGTDAFSPPATTTQPLAVQAPVPVAAMPQTSASNQPIQHAKSAPAPLIAPAVVAPAKSTITSISMPLAPPTRVGPAKPTMASTTPSTTAPAPAATATRKHTLPTVLERSSPAQKASIELFDSPNRRTRGALSSPSPNKRGKKRSSADGSIESSSATGASALERGERLIERLRARVNEAQAQAAAQSAAVATTDTLLEPLSAQSNGSGASDSPTTQAPLLQSLPCYPRLLTRRLDFDAAAAGVHRKRVGEVDAITRDNCVPAPPAIECFAVASPPPPPLQSSLLLSVEPVDDDDALVREDEEMADDEPTFALLPSWSNVVDAPADDRERIVAGDVPAPPASAAAPSSLATESHPLEKPKRSLALRRTVDAASSQQQQPQLQIQRNAFKSPVQAPLLLSTTTNTNSNVHAVSNVLNLLDASASPLRAHDKSSVRSETMTISNNSSSALRASPQPQLNTSASVALEPTTSISTTPAAQRTPIVIPIDDDDDDFDDFDDVPLARPPAKRQKQQQTASPVAAAAAGRKRKAQTSPLQSTALVMSAKTSAAEAAVASTPTDCCAVCIDVESFDDDPIVYCDGCDLGVHQFCYGIATLPSGSWFCDACVVMQITTTKPARTLSYFGATSSTNNAPKKTRPKCALCPVRGGALKPTQCGRWAHVQCFMWLPELQLVADCDVLTLGSLARLDPDRNTLECSLCHARHGGGVGIIQCASKRCLVAFHVSCAACADYALVQEEQADGGDTLFLAYCPLHARKRRSAAMTTTTTTTAAAPANAQTPVKSTPKTTDRSSSAKAASPSALLFSPTQHDSAKKFRKFRRLKRKYDASQRSQSPLDARTSIIAQTQTQTTATWGKRMVRSQQYKAGRRQRVAEAARMFIEDDVEVDGDDDDDDDRDDDDDSDAPNAMDDSFINDSSQLLYSPLSPTQHDNNNDDQAAGRDTAKHKKRKRASPGDMRAIYARSLLESQHDLPAFMRRGQRDLPQGGIISACLEELRKPPPPLPPSPASSATSLLSPAPTMRSTTAGVGASVGAQHSGAQQSLISLLSPNAPSSASSSSSALVVTPQQQQLTPEVRRRLDTAQRTDAMPAVAASARVVQRVDTFAVPLPPHESSTDNTTDDDVRSLQQRIEANRLRALEKLRARQLLRAQQPSAPHTATSAAPTATTTTNASTRRAPQYVTNTVPLAPSIPAPLAPTTAFSSSTVLLRDSQANAVPEPPSFSLFPTLSVAETPTWRDTNHVERVAAPPVRLSPPPPPPVQPHEPLLSTPASRSVPSLPPRLSPPPSSPPPQLAVYVSATSALVTILPALTASCSLDTAAVERVERLEADALVSVRVAVVAMTPLEFTATATDTDVVVTAPQSLRLRTCASIFKRVLVIVRATDAAAAQTLQRSAAMATLRESSKNMDVVVCASDEHLCRHLLETARREHDEGYSLLQTTSSSMQSNRLATATTSASPLDAAFAARFAFFRSLSPLSIGSALSLSFRFSGFAVAQMPVRKFNEMHWKRMLPWLSDAAAKQLPDHVRRKQIQATTRADAGAYDSGS